MAWIPNQLYVKRRNTLMVLSLIARTSPSPARNSPI